MDEAAHLIKDVRDHLITVFNLTDEDLDERVPSGQQTKLANRLGWGRTHLKKAGLIEQVDRGVYRITAAAPDPTSSPFQPTTRQQPTNNSILLPVSCTC